MHVTSSCLLCRKTWVSANALAVQPQDTSYQAEITSCILGLPPLMTVFIRLIYQLIHRLIHYKLLISHKKINNFTYLLIFY